VKIIFATSPKYVINKHNNIVLYKQMDIFASININLL
jgi:hypothetical protein